MANTDLTIHRSQEMSQQIEFDADRLALLRKTICPPNITQPEFDLFVAICKRSGLDPFARQVYCVKRGAKMSVDTSIDGFRLLACRSGQYEGQVGPLWCGSDGKWVDVWLGCDPPMAAKVGVYRSGFREPAWGVALFNEFASFYNNQLSGTWAKLPTTMLAKCAESQALRKAFPAELSGLYTSDEMGQADGTSTAATTNGHNVDRETGEITQAEFPNKGGSVETPEPAVLETDCRPGESDEDWGRRLDVMMKAKVAQFGMKGPIAVAVILTGKDRADINYDVFIECLNMPDSDWQAAKDKYFPTKPVEPAASMTDGEQNMKAVLSEADSARTVEAMQR